MPRTKSKVLSDHLPPTPCTPKMREMVLAVARERNVSIAEIQRAAISLFLSENVSSNTNLKDFIAKPEIEPA